MKAYGVRRKDISRCCPGHDKYPRRPYPNTPRRRYRRDDRVRKGAARMRTRLMLHKLQVGHGE